MHVKSTTSNICCKVCLVDIRTRLAKAMGKAGQGRALLSSLLISLREGSLGVSVDFTRRPPDTGRTGTGYWPLGHLRGSLGPGQVPLGSLGAEGGVTGPWALMPAFGGHFVLVYIYIYIYIYVFAFYNTFFNFYIFHISNIYHFGAKSISSWAKTLFTIKTYSLTWVAKTHLKHTLLKKRNI